MTLLESITQPFFSFTQHTAAAALNTCLRHDDTLRQHLASHEQKHISFQTPYGSFQYRIHSGQFRVHPLTNKKPDLTLTFPPHLIDESINQWSDITEKIRIEGDTSLAHDLHFILKNGTIPLEDIAAHFIGSAQARAVTHVLSQIREALSLFYKNCRDRCVNEGMREEKLFVSQDAWDTFWKQADNLVQRMHTLEQRIRKHQKKETHENDR